MKNKALLGLSGAVLLGLGLVTSVAFAQSSVSSGTNPLEREQVITGTELTQASAAALAHVGSGRVTSTEVNDEESKYEVEVTREDGSQVDVQLDEKFSVVGDKVDSEE